MKNRRIENRVSVEKVLASKAEFVEVISEIDSLCGVYRKIGDNYARISTVTYAELGLSTRVPRVIDVTPFATYYQLEALVEDAIVGQVAPQSDPSPPPQDDPQPSALWRDSWQTW